MKKVMAGVFILVLLSAGAAFAQGEAHMNTGCGLGTMLWESDADGSIVSQTLQATTNGTFATQLFGISTGTSECKQPSKVVKNDRLNRFVAENLDNVAKDIAMGKGESLQTVAELMAISPEKRAGFYARLQSNFSQIFTSGKVEAAEVIDNIIVVSTQS